MSAHEGGDFAPLMADVARALLGEPKEVSKPKHEWRYGTRGSLAVDVARGVWRDHERGVGGGVLDLLQDQLQTDRNGALAWLHAHEHMPDRPAQQGTDQPKPKPRIVASYGYTDEAGKLLFEVVRYEPKNFRQRRPDGRGGWVWNLIGVRRVLYRLPEVVAGVAARRTIYIPEGEKGVDALAGLGVVATCSPGGAGKWRDEYSGHFVDADVVVLSDNDPQSVDPKTDALRWHPDGRPVLPGQDHAADIAGSLKGIASRVRVLMLPNLPLKGDVADWIAAGGTAAELERLAAAIGSNGVDHEHASNGAAHQGNGLHHEAEHAGPSAGARFVWPAPLDFLANTDTAAPELRHDHIPAALNDFVFDTSARMGVDPTSVALPAVTSCASVIDDAWKIQPKRYDYEWTESARLWNAIVGNPSIMKSPIIARCTRPIDRMEAAGRDRHAEAMRLYRQQKKAAKADKTGETPEPPHPKRERYLLEDATMEAFAEMLRNDEESRQRAPSGKALLRQDEMSEFFANMDRYRQGGKGGGDRGAFLRLYNGGGFNIDRIGRGNFHVENWSACFLGGIQPDPIRQIAKSSVEDGLLQRFLYVVPGPPTPGQDRKPSAEAGRRYDALFPALAAMHPPPSNDGEHTQPIVFHADAHRHREAVDQRAHIEGLLPDRSPQLLSALGKWRGQFARLALTFHMIDTADARARGEQTVIPMVITEATAACVARLMLEIVLPHLLRAHRAMFDTSQQTTHAEWIAGHILSEKLDRIMTGDVVHAYRPLRAPEKREELLSVMNALVLYGWLEPQAPTNAVKPVNVWQVNPKVHDLFARRGAEERGRRETARAELAAHLEARRQT